MGTPIKDNERKYASTPDISLRQALSRAWQLRGQQQWTDASRTCDAILSQHPHCDEAWHLLGLLANDQGIPDQAVPYFEKAISCAPENPAHYCNLGVVLSRMGAHERSESYLCKALEISPDLHDARCNLGLAQFHQYKRSRAVENFEMILKADPDYAAAWANLGMTHLAQQRYAEAITAYGNAIELEPNHAEWYGNLGAAQVRQGDFPSAVDSFRTAAKLDKDKPDYQVNLGVALRASGDLAGSINVLDELVSRDSSITSAVAHLAVGLEYTCQWEKLDPIYPLLDSQTRHAIQQALRPDEDPMLNIRRSQNPALNQSVARAWSRNYLNASKHSRVQFSHNTAKKGSGPVTIGYLSYDYRNHPMAHQLHPLFAMHDRSRFRIVAFSMGPQDDSTYRKEIEAGCDAFVDISQLGRTEAAQAIYDQEVDILVDLMGHSHHNRMELLAMRPAPIQVSYLGFLSTTGAPFIDYLITDSIVVPKEHTAYYDEKLIRLPHCYQFNHIDRGKTPTTMPDRESWGLPRHGFVFCSFNNAYKIDRSLFETWMRILKRTPGSVLWLSGGHEMATRQMQRHAAALGIDPKRLVFAQKRPLREHLQRLELADLALDTVRYNGGATTANALAAGVPVLTVLGGHWVSRMTASHLMSIGLSEFVLPSLSEYEQAAIDLATHPNELLTMRNRLNANKTSYPLFDSKRFVDHLESGYESIWQRYTNELAPDHIDIPQGNGKNRPDSAAVLQTENKHLSTACTMSGQNRPMIYYFCPDVQCKSAGIRRIHKHVDILNKAGFPSSLLFEKPVFALNDSPNVPFTDLSRINDNDNAIFVIPEGMPRIMYLLKDHPGRRFAIALSWIYVYSTLPNGMDWRDFKIERVIAFSTQIADMINWSMRLPVHLLASSIDHDLYFYDPMSKQMQISYINRKAEHAEKLRAVLASRNVDYLNKFKWVKLSGLSLEAYAAQIRQSAIFLSTSLAEGFPLACLEAMASGALVAGYDAVGGKEVLAPDNTDPTAIMAPNGDYACLAYRLAPVLDDLLAGNDHRWHPLLERARQTALNCSPEKENSDLIAFWRSVLRGDDDAYPVQETSIPGRAVFPDAKAVCHGKTRIPEGCI